MVRTPGIRSGRTESRAVDPEPAVSSRQRRLLTSIAILVILYLASRGIGYDESAGTPWE